MWGMTGMRTASGEGYGEEKARRTSLHRDHAEEEAVDDRSDKLKST
jgi:hypothetical protein